jgi:hypothetical protein
VLDNKSNGGEGGIRARPFFEPSCCQGDGENPCEHGHPSTFSFSSYLSNFAPFDCFSVSLELMELMHPFLSRRSLYAADAASDAPMALHSIGTMPGNSAHTAESLLRTSAPFLKGALSIQFRMLP